MAKIVVGIFNDDLEVKEVMEDLKDEALDARHILLKVRSGDVSLIAVSVKEEGDEELTKEFFELHNASDTKTLG